MWVWALAGSGAGVAEARTKQPLKHPNSRPGCFGRVCVGSLFFWANFWKWLASAGVLERGGSLLENPVLFWAAPGCE